MEAQHFVQFNHPWDHEETKEEEDEPVSKKKLQNADIESEEEGPHEEVEKETSSSESERPQEEEEEEEVDNDQIPGGAPKPLNWLKNQETKTVEGHGGSYKISNKYGVRV